MDPSEVEFLAEKEKISIQTNFSEDKIYLIGVGVFITKKERYKWIFFVFQWDEETYSRRRLFARALYWTTDTEDATLGVILYT